MNVASAVAGHELSTRPAKTFAKLPDGEQVVSMCSHKGSVIVASNKSVYILSEKGTLTKVLFEDNGL